MHGSVIIKGVSCNEDVDVILELLYDLRRPKPSNDSDLEKFRGLIQKYITDSDKKILVAKIDKIGIVGIVSMIFLPRLNHTSFEMYISELIVSEKFRGMGIGKKLLDACIKLAQEKNCHRIRLESGNQRKQSHEFYKKLGFDQASLSFTKILENIQ